MKEIAKNIVSFEDIKHIDENGVEFWYARELMPILQYAKWQNFKKIIDKAMIACQNSEISIKDCFTDISKPIISGKGKQELIEDYKLTRYACYLIAQNGDSRKKVIALAQTYFAVQTRKQEISEKEYSLLTEDEKRFYQRNLTRKGNYSLNQTAKKAGVKNFDKFHNSGYKGLYNGETADDIAKRKGLRYREDILDNIKNNTINSINITTFKNKVINDCLKKALLVEKRQKNNNALICFIIYFLIIGVFTVLANLSSIIQTDNGLVLLLYMLVLLVIGLLLPIYPIAAIIYLKTYNTMKNLNPYVRDKEAKDINSKLEGLKNYINEYSLLNDKEYKDLIIWENYLVYSIILGYNTKIVKEVMQKITN